MFRKPKASEIHFFDPLNGTDVCRNCGALAENKALHHQDRALKMLLPGLKRTPSRDLRTMAEMGIAIMRAAEEFARDENWQRDSLEKSFEGMTDSSSVE